MERSIAAVFILAALVVPNELATLLARVPAQQPVPPTPAHGNSTQEDLAIIVNRSNPVDNLPFADLRKIFLGERSHWPNGRKITVLMRGPGQPEREAALHLIYRMSERDFNRHFLQAAFTGAVQAAPKELVTTDGVHRFIFNVPGAIGYVRANELDESAKLVRVDGRAPGEPGYKLRLSSQ